MAGVTLTAPGSSGFGTRLINSETGDEIKGITRINIDIVPDDIIRIEAHIFSTGLDVSGELSLYVADPSTGETKQPVRIEFADGSTWEAP